MPRYGLRQASRQVEMTLCLMKACSDDVIIGVMSVRLHPNINPLAHSLKPVTCSARLASSGFARSQKRIHNRPGLDQ